MQHNHLPDGTTHYELMLTERTAVDVYADHRSIQHGESFSPSYPLASLVADYIAEQDLETRAAFKDDVVLRNAAVDYLFGLAKDANEYDRVWEARVEGEKTNDFRKAERLAAHLRGKIEQQLMNAGKKKLTLYGNAEQEAIIAAKVEKHAEFHSKKYYDRQAYLDNLTRSEDYAFQKEEATDEAKRLVERWLVDPIGVQQELKEIRIAYEKGEMLRDGPRAGEFVNEAYLLVLEREFARRTFQHQTQEYIEEAQAQVEAGRFGVAKGSPIRDEVPDGQQSIEDVIEANNAMTDEEKGRLNAAAAEKLAAEKAKATSQPSSPGTTSSRNTRPGGPTGATHQPQKPKGEARVDAGFYNYDMLPDGDQLFQEESPGLGAPPDEDDGIIRPHRRKPDPVEKKSNMDRVRDAQRNYPKLGKQQAQAVQAGAALGRVYTLPDAEEIEAGTLPNVKFKRRPGRWLKVKATAFYLRHRKSVNVVAKLTAFIALQLGAATLAGRFEFKEDRHFVQMVLMTVMGFVLTSSLAKDGVPVNNAAFII